MNDDPRRLWLCGTGIPVSQAPPNNMVNEYHDICSDVDSYILVFSGRRGGGNTTSMTDETAKAAIISNMGLLSNYPIVFTARYLDGHNRQSCASH
jgi:predicted alpha/beta-hydrolase family hydrolase